MIVTEKVKGDSEASPIGKSKRRAGDDEDDGGGATRKKRSGAPAPAFKALAFEERTTKTWPRLKWNVCKPK